MERGCAREDIIPLVGAALLQESVIILLTRVIIVISALADATAQLRPIRTTSVTAHVQLITIVQPALQAPRRMLVRLIPILLLGVVR